MASNLTGTGAQHRRGVHRDRERRSVEEDHGERVGRDPAVEGDHQHDGRSAQPLCRRGDARGARGRHGRAAGRPGAGVGCGRHVEGPDRQRELDGVEPDGPGAQHRRGGDRGGAGRSVEEDHGERVGRDPAVEGDHQHDGRSAQRVRRRGDARGARGRHRRAAGRTGERAGCGGHVEGPDRQRELDGVEPDGSGAQHRRGGDRDRERRSVAQDHRRCARRDPSVEGNAEHDGGSAQPLRRRGDARGARGRHRRAARRSGAGAGCCRHVEGPDRQRELDGVEPDGAGAQHRGGDNGGGARRSRPQDHRGREGRNPGAEEHHQHDGRSAQRIRLRGDARCARGRDRRQAGWSGGGAGRGGHVEGPDRQRQLHGVEPDRPGAQHRRGGDRDCQRRSVEEDHRGCARRNPAAEGDAEHDGGSAPLVRRRGDAGGARGRHRRAAGWAGGGARRRRHVEGPDRQRQPAGGQSQHAGAQHRRGHHGGGARRSVAQDHRRCVG